MANKRGVETYPGQFDEWFSGIWIIYDHEPPYPFTKPPEMKAQLSADYELMKFIEQGRNS